MEWTKIVLIIAAIGAAITGIFFFQYEAQDPAIVEQYQEEITDQTDVKDVFVRVSEEVTEQQVINAVLEKYPGYKVLEISQENDVYIVRIAKEVN